MCCLLILFEADSSSNSLTKLLIFDAHNHDLGNIVQALDLALNIQRRDLVAT